MTGDDSMMDYSVEQEFLDLVNFTSESAFEENIPLKLYAYACAKHYVPEGQTYEQWSQTAMVTDFFEKIYAMETLPAELHRTAEMTDDKRIALWKESAKKKFTDECENKILPLVREAIEQDARLWNETIPTTNNGTSPEYQDFMMKMARIKAYELHGYLFNVEYGDGEFDFDSEDKHSRIMQVEKEFENLLNTEECLNIPWHARPIRMNDAEWVNEKKQMIKHEQDQDKMEEEKKTVEEREEEKLQQEENERETARAHALRHQSNETVGPRTIFEPGLRKMYTDVVAILWYWWDHGPQQDQMNTISTMNEQMRLTFSKNDYIPIAPSELSFWIKEVQQDVKESRMASGQEKDEKILKLAKDVVQLTNILRRYGFDWKTIASRKIQRDVLTLLYSSDSSEVQKRRTAFVRSLLEPEEGQHEFLEKFKSMLTVVKIAKDQNSLEALRAATASLKTINDTEVAKINSDLGLKKDDHCFPIIHLEIMEEFGRFDENEIAKMLAKLRILGVPIQDFGESFTLTDQEQELMEKELLGLFASEKQTSEVQTSYPRLTFGGAEMLYGWCAEKRTLAWGKARGTFFINQYGPDTAPIFRKESRPIPGYLDSRYVDGLPPKQNVSNADNRIGSILEHGSNTKKMYKARDHIREIYGVAFTEDPKQYPGNKYAYLKEARGVTRDSVYVLIGWDRFLNNNDLEKRWEPASELRSRLKSGDGDAWIMAQAKKNQERFAKHYNLPQDSDVPSLEETVSSPASRLQSSSVSERTRRGRDNRAADSNSDKGALEAILERLDRLEVNRRAS